MSIGSTSISAAYKGPKGREILSTVLGNRALDRGDTSPSAQQIVKTHVENRQKGQKKILKANLLSRTPQSIAQTQQAQPTTGFRKRMQELAKGLKYPIITIDSLAKKYSSSAPGPIFSKGNLSHTTLEQFQKASDTMGQAAIALNKGQHFVETSKSLDNAKVQLNLRSQDKSLLQQLSILKNTDGADTIDPEAMANLPRRVVSSPSVMTAVNKALNRWYYLTSGEKNLTRVTQQMKQTWRENWRRYQKKNDAVYPFRKPDGTNYRVTGISPSTGLSSFTRSNYPASAIKPFINSKVRPEERAQLNSSIVTVRSLTAADRKKPEEKAIEMGAFAARDIKAGECIGPYGGIVFPFAEVKKRAVNDEYTRGSQDLITDGDTALSRANTVVNYDAFGRAKNESRVLKDFNIEFADYDSKLEDGKKYTLGAGFALRDIKKGDELRVHYGYTPEQIQRKMN